MVKRCAPAKVNLSLHIVGRREDGYHELFTRMQKIDLCDWLFVEYRSEPGIDFSCSDPELPVDTGNLAVAAATAFLKAVEHSERKGLSIRLEKNIPVAAGLGGGSSDAGTLLQTLNELYDYPCSREQLITLAQGLGADVPFFAVPDTAVIAEGIGERLTTVPDAHGYWLLLINPAIKVSTRWVFENYALTTNVKNSTLTGFRNTDTSDFSPAQMHNDLEQVTMSRYPVINSIKDSLCESGAVAAMMSGSGPTVFGLFPGRQADEKEKYRLVEQFSTLYGCRVFATRIYAGA